MVSGDTESSDSRSTGLRTAVKTFLGPHLEAAMYFVRVLRRRTFNWLPRRNNARHVTAVAHCLDG